MKYSDGRAQKRTRLSSKYIKPTSRGLIVGDRISLQRNYTLQAVLLVCLYGFSIVYLNIYSKRTLVAMHPYFIQHSNQQYHQPVQHYPPRPNPPHTHTHQPPHPHQLPPHPHHHPQTERIMYHSTIQPNSSQHQNAPALRLGRLETMGRVVKEEPEQVKNSAENNAVFQPQRPVPLTFRTNQPERPKMASSVIFFNKNSQPLGHCYSFNNMARRQPQQHSSTGFDSLLSKARSVKEQEVIEAPVDKKHQENIGLRHFHTLQNDQQLTQSANHSQKVWRSQIIGQGLSFDDKIAFKNPKQFQFHRNASAKNNKGQAKQRQLHIQRQPQVQPCTKEETRKNSTKTEHQPQKFFMNQGQSLTKPQLHPESNGMFKKKNPYQCSTQSGKTDQNLLKMLGINLKKSRNKEESISPSNHYRQHINLDVHQGNAYLGQPLGKNQPQSQNKNPTLPATVPRKIQKSDFTVGKKMGKGQFGQVMLVQHKETGFICGMKVMNKRQIKLQKYENQIARQLSIQFYLSHRNIAPLYGYFQDQENVYLLVQFCSEGQLLQMLRKNRRMEEQDVSPIIRQICEGLDYVHKEDIIHRDIKPQNILFSFGTVKISDFGWAVHCGNGMRRTVSGSPLYYSPEVVLETAYDEKIDLWAIGMMTYECLLGKIPFRIYSQLDLNRIVEDQIKFPEYVDVSEEAKDFILRIMKKKPEERMQMRQILRHPFITKYPREKKVPSSALEEFRNILQVDRC